MTLVPICPACRETRALLAKHGGGADAWLLVPWPGPQHMPNCPAFKGTTFHGIPVVTFAVLPGDWADAGPTKDPEAEKTEPTSGFEPETC